MPSLLPGTRSHAAAARYKGPTFWEVLDNLKLPERDDKKPFRIPLLDGYKDMGSIMGIGKVSYTERVCTSTPKLGL